MHAVQICVGRHQRSHTQGTRAAAQSTHADRKFTAPPSQLHASPFSRVAGSARLRRRKGGGWSVRSAALADKRGVSSAMVKFAFAFCTAFVSNLTTFPPSPLTIAPNMFSRAAAATRAIALRHPLFLQPVAVFSPPPPRAFTSPLDTDGNPMCVMSAAAHPRHTQSLINCLQSQPRCRPRPHYRHSRVGRRRQRKARQIALPRTADRMA